MSGFGVDVLGQAAQGLAALPALLFLFILAALISRIASLLMAGSSVLAVVAAAVVVVVVGAVPATTLTCKQNNTVTMDYSVVAVYVHRYSLNM